MKSLILLILACVLVSSPAQTFLPPGPPTVSERGPHHRTWQTVHERVQPNGKIIRSSNSIIELAIGMHYKNDPEGPWLEASEEIEIINGAAVARHSQNRVIFAANIKTAGSVDLLTVDHNRLRSNVLGIVYTDAATGESVPLASVKDSIGAVLPPNQVYYIDALDGPGISADVRYTVTRDSLEQEILFRAAPPPPSDFGLSEDTRLEVITEFIEAPAPAIQEVTLRREPNAQRRLQMAEPDLIDQRLKFGVMEMGTGSAFRLDDENALSDGAVLVGKSWHVGNDQRQFLIEKVDYRSIQPKLAGLPQAKLEKKGRQKMMARVFPPAPPSQGATISKPIRVAARSPAPSGFSMDYTVVSTSSNYVFRGDCTYYITGNITLSGTNILEGGAVLKMTNATGSSPKITLSGLLECRTSPGRPAIFTAKDDDSVGEKISISTGAPSPGVYYGRRTLEFTGTAAPYDIHDIRIHYSKEAVQLGSGTSLNLRNGQIGYGDRAFGTFGSFGFQNVLVHDHVTGFFTGVTNRGEQVTFHRLSNGLLTGTGAGLDLTNSLIISVTNFVAFRGSNVETNVNDTGIFQTVGEGGRYLVSAYRNAGTTNINPGLLADLQNLTTYPPLVLTNTIAVDTVWNPQAQRDADGSPDLGYHYHPLDYLVSGLTLTNATLLITNGTTIGIDFNRANYGLKLHSGARLISEGSPNNMNRFVRLHGVQERRGTSGSNGVATLADYYPAVTAPELHLRFTDLPMMAGNYYHLLEPNNDGNFSRFTLRDSEIRGGKFYLSSRYTGTNDTIGWTNNLLDRVVTQFRPYPPMSIHLWNNSFRGGIVDVFMTDPTYTIKDNVFDQTILYTNEATNIVADYNGYVTNGNRWPSGGGHDKILNTTNVVWETFAKRSFYLPTNSFFINAGSRSATYPGLSFCTTETNQVAETNSTVDLGYHYVSLDAGGQPLDSDADGMPDYFEDINGNGSINSGETDWNDPFDLGLRVLITKPGFNSIIP